MAAALTRNAGFVGRVAPEKSPGLFVAAARIVRATLRSAPLASRRAVRFEVVGDGHVRRMLEAWARASAGREESGGDVEFTGWVEWAKGESARVAAEELAQCRYTNILDGRRRGKDPSAVPCRSPRAQSSPLL
jgi:glycosyltransferase involved in cell wall biosynthesis